MSLAASLRPYQVPHARTLLKALKNYGAALDASDTGTGKTFVALQLCKWLDVVPVVICPRSVVPTWQRVAEQIGVGADVINYEKVRRPDYGYGIEKPWGSGSFWRWNHNFSAIIFDEAHNCGGTTTLNSKMVIASKRQSQFTMLLSATMADDVRQMKAAGFALGLHDLKKWHNFLYAYGCEDNWRGQIVPGDDYQAGLQKLHEKIFPARGSRMRKSEIPGFPKTQIEMKLLDSDKAGTAADAAADAYARNDIAALHASRQTLELMMTDDILDLADTYGKTSRVAVFVSYKKTLNELVEKFQWRYGGDGVGWIDGSQVGEKGAEERQRFVDRFQANDLPVIVVNSQAGNAGINLHDPKGKVDRTELVTPQFSGRTLEQVFGRVNRDGGAFSQCFLLAFRHTRQEKVAEIVMQRRDNLSLLNDGVLAGVL